MCCWCSFYYHFPEALYIVPTAVAASNQRFLSNSLFDIINFAAKPKSSVHPDIYAKIFLFFIIYENHNREKLCTPNRINRPQKISHTSLFREMVFSPRAYHLFMLVLLLPEND